MSKPADIEALDHKIKAFKKKKETKRQKENAPHPTGSAAKGFQYSVELISGVFIGTAVGYFLDGLFQTTPWFLVVFTIFGGAAGILNVYKSAKGEDEK